MPSWLKKASRVLNQIRSTQNQRRKTIPKIWLKRQLILILNSEKNHASVKPVPIITPLIAK